MGTDIAITRLPVGPRTVEQATASVQLAAVYLNIFAFRCRIRVAPAARAPILIEAADALGLEAGHIAARALRELA